MMTYCQQHKFASVSWNIFRGNEVHGDWGRTLRFVSLHFGGLRELNIDASNYPHWGFEHKSTRQLMNQETFRAVLTGCPMLRVLKMCSGIALSFFFVIDLVEVGYGNATLVFNT